MKKNLHLDEFETFLSESVEGHRMYPSDGVWQNIDQQLERNRRWPALGFASAITGAIIMAGIFFLQPDKDLFENHPTGHLAVSEPRPADGHNPAQSDIHPSWNGKSAKRQAKVVALSPAPISENEAAYNHEALVASGSASAMQSPATVLPADSRMTQGAPSYLAAADDGSGLAPIIPLKSTLLATDELQYKSTQPVEAGEQLAATASNASPVAKGADAAAAAADAQSLHESIARPVSKKASGWSVQYYATPSISYRFIDEEKNLDPALVNSGVLPPYYQSKVNQLVNHKPKLGMEAGVAWQYRVSERLSVKMGIQANYRQFAIEAFETAPSAAMLRLDQGAVYDTIVRMSSFNNFGGNQPTELTNRYLQFALPVGFELALTNGPKAQFVVGTTLQPTYVASQQTWLLSSDYQHYTKESSLMKRFNMNMGVEMMFRFTGAGLNWQVGPQVRYQMQPSVNTQYPIREHLVDYGLKFGVIKTLK